MFYTPLMKLRLLCCLAVLVLPSTAAADGDDMLSPSFFESGPGYGLVSTGVGLAGRRPQAIATNPRLELKRSAR